MQGRRLTERAGYHALSLVHYFTAGADEVRAWTIRDGTKAPQAAGVIHTDFEKVRTRSLIDTVEILTGDPGLHLC